MVVGSIWAFYAFVIFGLTPILWPNYETEILYWSNFLQLVFLPVITVGTAIMNRDSEKRALEDHHTIQRQFDMLKETHRCMDLSLERITAGVQALLSCNERERTAALRAIANADSPHAPKKQDAPKKRASGSLIASRAKNGMRWQRS
jgi:hypothetical protein